MQRHHLYWYWRGSLAGIGFRYQPDNDQKILETVIDLPWLVRSLIPTPFLFGKDELCCRITGAAENNFSTPNMVLQGKKLDWTFKIDNILVPDCLKQYIYHAILINIVWWRITYFDVFIAYFADFVA